MLNGAITLLVFSKINFQGALGDGKSNPIVKIYWK